MLIAKSSSESTCVDVISVLYDNDDDDDDDDASDFRIAV